MINRPSPPTPEMPPRAAALTFDFQEYQQFVEDSELSESQQRELLTALWEIIVSFVDLGFQIHPIQLVTKDAKTLELDSPRVVGSDNISMDTQAGVADLFEQVAERIDS